MLKVRPHTKSGGRGGGDSPLQVRYTKIRKVGKGGGGGEQFVSGPIRKVGGGGGGGPDRFSSDTFVWHTENTLSLIMNGYKFDRGVAQAPGAPPPPPGYATDMYVKY